MTTNIKKLKYPERRPAPNKIDPITHEAKTEDFDTLPDTLTAELNFINEYLNCGHARGRAHSRAAIVDGKPGYFFVTSIDIGRGIRRDCIIFSTLIDKDMLLTDLD